MFSKACEYAIRAVLYICIKGVGSKLSIKEITQEIGSPEPFTAKILQTLSRKGIISSIKGPNGGFFLKPEAKPITLNAIVKAMDGEDIFHSCLLGLKQCSDKFPCPIHDEVKVYKNRMRDIMREKTVQQLAGELARGKTFLRNGR